MKNLSKVFVLSIALAMISAPVFAADVATKDSCLTNAYNSVKGSAVAAKNWVGDKSVAAYTWVKDNPVHWISENPWKSAGVATAVAAVTAYYFYVYKAQQEEQRALLYAE